MIPLVILLLVSVPVIFAEDPTSIDIYWDGEDALVIYNIVSGDDTSTWFTSSGDYIVGEFHAIDYNDDPGGFDTFETNVSASFSGGGEIKLLTEMIDSRYNSTFRPYSYTKIESNTSSGYLGWKTITNYTHLLNFNSDNLQTYEIQADGYFEVAHELYNPEGDGIILKGEGVGSIFIDLNKEWVNGTAFESGIEEGCYAVAYGSGQLKLESHADNYLRGDGVFEMPGGALYETVTGDWFFEMFGGGSTTLDFEYLYNIILEDFGSKGD